MPISWKEMCKLFLHIGYEIVPGAGKGSHIKLQKKGCPTITVPHHKEINKKTEHILRKMLTVAKERIKKYEISFQNLL